jgi:AcrR family transcriptional regulator
MRYSLQKAVNMPRLTAVRRRAVDEIMKEAVFEAAVAVLIEHGVEGMTMDRVASAADVAKGSLYNYFRSKQELLHLVYAKTVEPVFHDLEETVALERPAKEKLAFHLHQVLKHVAKHLQVFRLLFQDATAQGILQSSERTAREAASQRLAIVFRQGIDEGVFRAGDPLMLARMFMGICTGVFDSHPRLEEPEEREIIHRLIMDTFLNGIVAEKR